MNKRIFIFLVCVFVVLNITKAQGTFVNKDFEVDAGSPLFNPILNPLGLEWSKSILIGGGSEILTTGYTSVPGQGQDIFLSKHDAHGTLIFSTSFNSSSSNNDYGIGIYETSNNDIIVCGTTDNGGTTNYDIVVLRFNSSGVLLNSSIHDGPASKNDVAVSLIEDAFGHIIVAANTEDSNGFYDYWVLKLSTTLNLISDNKYDFMGLNDLALGLEISGGDIHLIGASASGTNSCDYAVAVFDGSSLGYLSDSRNNLPGTALDQALAFKKDASNNMYITGKGWNGNDFDIKTVKIASNLSIVWTATVDAYGFDDAANTLDIDPITNDIIIGGYATRPNGKKELICIRLSSSNGSIITTNKLYSESPSGDAYIKKIVTNTVGEVYYVGGEKGLTGKKQVIVGKFKPSGVNSWQKKVFNNTEDILPSDIEYSSSGVYVISILDSTINAYVTTKYSEMELDTSRGFYGPARYKKNELIVRFLPSALDSVKIDNLAGAITEFEDLSYYMKPTAYSTVTNALESICRDCEIKAVKIFPGHSTTYTTTTSGLGETISVPDFWTALLLVFPQNSDVHQLSNIFNSMTSVAAYSHPNWMVQLYSTPDDSLYSQQYSLHSNTVYPGCDINVEEAWEIAKEGGKPNIRCGVFDVGLDWENVDFGYDGLDTNSSKIAGGFNFVFPYAPLKAFAHGDANGNLHATAVAGIIGAQRNNNRGIAGIAGGNDSISSKGISLYGCTVFLSNGGPLNSFTFAPMSYIAHALYWTTQAPVIPQPVNQPYLNMYTFKIRLENLSWGLYLPPTDTGGYVHWVESINLFHETMHKLNRMKVTAVVARGNDSLTQINYPACSDDDWVITVTGTGVDGQFAHNSGPFAGPVNAEFTSNWGGPVDIAAPSSGSIITTLSTPNNNNWGSVYNSFGGTSAAAPHVTGAVGLLMSYMNDTIDSYKNLAPEDNEYILQLSATDTDSAGYDALTGYGRLNVGKALKTVHKSYAKLLHFGTLSPWAYNTTISLYSASDTIRTTERFQHPLNNNLWFQRGKYFVRTYEVTSVVNHYISPQDTIIASWPRHSSTVTWPLFLNGKLMPREKTKIISLDHSYATLKGYIYHVQDSLGNSVGWWPVDTAFAGHTNYGSWAEYSVLTRNMGNPVGITEKHSLSKNIKVFPNPTNGIQTIEISTEKICELNVDLYDVMGRKIASVFSGKSNQDKTEIKYDASNLPNSLYIYVVKIDGQIESLRFIKQ